MPKRVDLVVLFPRYTSFVGTTALYSAPLDIRDYSEAILTGWQGTGLGGTPATVQFTVQQSTDLEVWHDGTPFTPGAGAETTSDEHLRRAWMRVKAAVSGTDPGVSCWLVGEFVRREGPGAGGGA